MLIKKQCVAARVYMLFLSMFHLCMMRWNILRARDFSCSCFWAHNNAIIVEWWRDFLNNTFEHKDTRKELDYNSIKTLTPCNTNPSFLLIIHPLNIYFLKNTKSSACLHISRLHKSFVIFISHTTLIITLNSRNRIFNIY